MVVTRSMTKAMDLAKNAPPPEHQHSKRKHDDIQIPIKCKVRVYVSDPCKETEYVYAPVNEKHREQKKKWCNDNKAFYNEYMKQYMKKYSEKMKNDPSYKLKLAERRRRYAEKRKQDPERHAKYKEYMKAYNAKKRSVKKIK